MKPMNWQESVVLITGGTGSFGKKCAEILLRDFRPKKLIIFSRDELKQHEMQAGGFNHPSLRYFLGDIRDRDRLRRALTAVDLVIHAAALKQVPACEYNPGEAVKTNVDGAQNIVDAAIDCGVQRVLALSTDKAVNPVNLYGATKLCAEKIFVQGNAYAGADGTRFSCTRYGNVLGSRGSVIPVFRNQRASGKVMVTDGRMTRFWLTLDQGVRFVINCIERMCGGEVFVPKIPSMKILDLAQAIVPECKVEFMGIRSGEKLHEVMISRDEARLALDAGDMYVLQPAHSWWAGSNWTGAKPVAEGFEYASDSNDQWMTIDELRKIVGEHCSETAAPR
jgi:UDP-N-acetylglucosamine 4,6-dehydratase/5-epimerase